MKSKVYVLLLTALLAMAAVSCGSEDEINESVAPVNVDDVNVLLIQSDKGTTSIGTMYKSGEIYSPPHCYLGGTITFERDTIYHMSFSAKIKGSDVFTGLSISFESDQPMSFSNLKEGDVFDSSQFYAGASYIPAWAAERGIKTMQIADAIDGKLTVVGSKDVGDKSYIVLRLTNLQFRYGGCVYTVNGTVEYEITSTMGRIYIENDKR